MSLTYTHKWKIYGAPHCTAEKVEDTPGNGLDGCKMQRAIRGQVGQVGVRFARPICPLS